MFGWSVGRDVYRVVLIFFWRLLGGRWGWGERAFGWWMDERMDGLGEGDGVGRRLGKVMSMGVVGCLDV